MVAEVEVSHQYEEGRRGYKKGEEQKVVEKRGAVLRVGGGIDAGEVEGQGCCGGSDGGEDGSIVRGDGLIGEGERVVFEKDSTEGSPNGGCCTECSFQPLCCLWVNRCQGVKLKFLKAYDSFGLVSHPTMKVSGGEAGYRAGFPDPAYIKR